MQFRKHSCEKDNGLLIWAARKREEGRQSEMLLLCRPTVAPIEKAGTLAVMLI